MSEKITGYRVLDENDIKAINSLKELEAVANGVVDNMRDVPDWDQRCVSVAATHLEIAFMFLVKAVAKPERKTKKEDI